MGRIGGTAPDTPTRRAPRQRTSRTGIGPVGRGMLVSSDEAAIRAFLDEAPFPDETSTWRHLRQGRNRGCYRSNLNVSAAPGLAAAATSEPSYDGFTYWREDNFFSPAPGGLHPVRRLAKVAVDANCGWWSYSTRSMPATRRGRRCYLTFADDFIAKMGSSPVAAQRELLLFPRRACPMADRAVPYQRHGRRRRDREKREFHRTDATSRATMGSASRVIGCAPDAYLNTGSTWIGIQCCSGDAQCAVSPEQERSTGTRRSVTGSRRGQDAGPLPRLLTPPCPPVR